MKIINSKLYVTLINHNVPEEAIIYFLNYLSQYFLQLNSNTKIEETKFTGYNLQVIELSDNIVTYPAAQERDGAIWSAIRTIGQVIGNKNLIRAAAKPVLFTQTDKFERNLNVITVGYNYRYTPTSYPVPYCIKAAYWPSVDKLFIEIK